MPVERQSSSELERLREIETAARALLAVYESGEDITGEIPEIVALRTAMADVEPHVNVFGRGCPVCEWRTLKVVAVPKLATGEQFPQFAACEACGVEVDFVGDAPPLRTELGVLERLDVQQREHEAWVQLALLMRAIGLDINTVDVSTFEPARLAMCRWALIYAEGFAAGVFTMPDDSAA